MKKLLYTIALLGAIFAPSFASAQSVAGCYRAYGTDNRIICDPAIQANKSVAINIAAAATTELIALTAATSNRAALAIYITHWDVMAAGTNNVTLVYGTGTACATGQVALTGAYPLTAQAGISAGVGIGPVLIVPPGNALCITTSGSGQLSGSVSYVQY